MKKNILLCIAIILYLLFLPSYVDVDIKVKAFATLVIIQILWMGRVFPLAHSSILLMLILSFHFFTYEETLDFIATDIVWLMFSIFIISHAFIKTGLASRISLMMLKLSRGSGRLLILIAYLLMFILSIMVPSNIGKASLLTSVFDSLLKSVQKIIKAKNLGKALFIGVSYLTATCGAFVATGASSTVYAYGIMSGLSPDLNYLNWILYFAPPIILFAFVLWGIFLFVYPPENIDKELLNQLINSKLRELGEISLSEKKMIVIISITVALWATQQLHHVSIPLIGLLGAVLTITPMVGVWNWNEAKQAIDWDMILFFASTIMVSGMLIDTGTIDLLAKTLMDVLPFKSSMLIVVALLIFILLLRIIFVNVLGFLTIVLPLALTLGETLPGFSSIVLTMGVFLIGIPGFLLITQSPVHLLTFPYGYYSERDLLRVGGISIVCWLVIILTTMMTYWIYIG
ncbi:SLC13 family permease [Virgibacillus salexigens]|uniref:SLC13 family permease n=1 Tax=Virgibacillus salexigens TaxID=61016 RepID=UPI00190DE497|nr:SLC13 family permease [Virgibacillus salexigens]